MLRDFYSVEMSSDSTLQLGLFNFIDENKELDMLPRYVTGSHDRMLYGHDRLQYAP